MMNRIVGHHAGSGYSPSREATQAYHRLIDGDGESHSGKFHIKDNAPQPGGLKPGTYAAHTWKLNTGAIGVAILAMGGGQWRDPVSSSHFPILPAQVDAYVKTVASLAVLYKIENEREFILTHAEVQLTLGVTQKQKWDFDYSPRYAHVSRDPIKIGDELRQEIAIKIAAIHKAEPVTIFTKVQPFLPVYPTIRQGSTGNNVVDLQKLLGRKADGIFGPRTRIAVVGFQRKKGLLPDGVVGPLTWATLGRTLSP